MIGCDMMGCERVPMCAPAHRFSAVAGGWDLGYNTRPPRHKNRLRNGEQQKEFRYPREGDESASACEGCGRRGTQGLGQTCGQGQTRGQEACGCEVHANEERCVETGLENRGRQDGEESAAEKGAAREETGETSAAKAGAGKAVIGKTGIRKTCSGQTGAASEGGVRQTGRPGQACGSEHGEGKTIHQQCSRIRWEIRDYKQTRSRNRIKEQQDTYAAAVGQWRDHAGRSLCSAGHRSYRSAE